MLAALLTSQSTLNQQDGWRICVAFPVLPSLLVLITLVFVPESPIWLISHKTPMGTSGNSSIFSDQLQMAMRHWRNTDLVMSPWNSTVYIVRFLMTPDMIKLGDPFSSQIAQ
jgi:hypothetical protein